MNILYDLCMIYIYDILIWYTDMRYMYTWYIYIYICICICHVIMDIISCIYIYISPIICGNVHYAITTGDSRKSAIMHSASRPWQGDDWVLLRRKVLVIYSAIYGRTKAMCKYMCIQNLYCIYNIHVYVMFIIVFTYL